MQIQIDARHFDLSDSLKEHIEAKSSYISEHLPETMRAHFVLIVEHGQSIAELNLHIPHHDIHSKAESNDMYNSIDQVIKTATQAMIKAKEKSN